MFYQLLMLRSLSLIFHTVLFNTQFPSNAIMMISSIMPIAMFDLLENPWDIDLTLLYEFDEYSQAAIDGVING